MTQLIEFINADNTNLILSVIWVALLGAIIVSLFKSRFSAVKQVNPQQLTLLINREQGRVADLRALKEFNQGHIAGSIHVPLEKAKKAEFVGLEKFKNDPIIVLCATGLNAQSVANGLVNAGFTNVNVLAGGINAWHNANLPLTTGK